MKDIIVIETTKECRPHLALREGINCIDTKYCKYEKVPESWEDLKELCKELKEYIIWNKNYCEIKNFKISKNGNIYYRQIQIYSDETITKNYTTVVNNRTIPQLWDFIKSLIGEE